MTFSIFLRVDSSSLPVVTSGSWEDQTEDHFYFSHSVTFEDGSLNMSTQSRFFLAFFFLTINLIIRVVGASIKAKKKRTKIWWKRKCRKKCLYFIYCVRRRSWSHHVEAQRQGRLLFFRQRRFHCIVLWLVQRIALRVTRLFLKQQNLVNAPVRFFQCLVLLYKASFFPLKGINFECFFSGKVN